MGRQEVVAQYIHFLNGKRDLDRSDRATAIEMVEKNCFRCIFHMEDSFFCGAHHDRTGIENPEDNCDDFSDRPGSGVSVEDAADWLHRRMRRMYKK